MPHIFVGKVKNWFCNPKTVDKFDKFCIMDEKGTVLKEVDPLLMNREMDYALRIMRALYQEKQLSAAAIAQREHMSKAVTLKILKQLHAAGLVDSRRGLSGGYLLLRSCDQLCLLDLFRALGEPPYINRCQCPGYRCENRPEGDCGLCRELSRIQEVLDEELQKTPLSAMIRE